MSGFVGGLRRFGHELLADLADPYGNRRAAAVDVRQVRTDERERCARYLERAAAQQRKTGLLSDVVTANQLDEAAAWLREPSVWDDDRPRLTEPGS